jgi:hypothetical protein
VSLRDRAGVLQLFRENRHRLLRARPVAVRRAVELEQVVIARAFDLLEAQHLRVRETPLLRRRADQLKNFLRFRRPLGQLRVRVVGNELQMETIPAHGAAVIARSAAPDQRHHRDFDFLAGRQRFFVKQRPKTVLPATAGQDDERQGEGEQRIFHAGLESDGAVYVQMVMGKLPVQYNKSAMSLSSCLYLQPGISLWHELVLLA